MTGDQVKGKGFRGALRYNLAKKENGVAKLLDMSFMEAKENSIMKEIQLVRMQRPNLAKYFYHTSINFPQSENLPDEKMKMIAREYLDSMGFDQHQFAIFRHFDADHPHLHILVNRIGYDGTVVSDSKDYERSEKALRSLEIKHGLTEVRSSKQAAERAPTKDELEMIRRTDTPSVKMQLQFVLKGILNRQGGGENRNTKLSIGQFIEALEAQGVNVRFNQASTGFVSGISYGYEGLQFNGAHLGNAYKWQAIKNGISYEQERDRREIREANLRTAAAITRAGRGTGTEPGGAVDTAGVPQSDDQPIHRTSAALQQGNGRLQDPGEHAKADGRTEDGEYGTDGNGSKQASRNDGTHHAEDHGRTQPDRQSVDRTNIPYSDFIKRLLGPDGDADRMDENALKEFEEKKKKKKKGIRL